MNPEATFSCSHRPRTAGRATRSHPRARNPLEFSEEPVLSCLPCPPSRGAPSSPCPAPRACSRRGHPRGLRVSGAAPFQACLSSPPSDFTTPSPHGSFQNTQQARGMFLGGGWDQAEGNGGGRPWHPQGTAHPGLAGGPQAPWPGRTARAHGEGARASGTRQWPRRGRGTPGSPACPPRPLLLRGPQKCGPTDGGLGRSGPSPAWRPEAADGGVGRACPSGTCRGASASSGRRGGLRASVAPAVGARPGVRLRGHEALLSGCRWVLLLQDDFLAQLMTL